MNGALNPEIDIAPGEIQRWRIYNATSGDFVKVQLQGHAFRLLARDGNYLRARKRMQVMTIPPASRREVLVRGGRQRRLHAALAAVHADAHGDEPGAEPGDAGLVGPVGR